MDHFSSTEYRPFHSMSETTRKCNSIHCREYVPSKHLKPYISRYWTMTSDMELENPILHRVIPDGCVDIIFDLNGRSCRGTGSIVGTMTKPIFAELKRRVNYIAIRFLPGGCLHFFDSAIYNFTDQIVPLEMVSGKEVRYLTEQLVMENQIEDKVKLIETYLGNLLRTDNRDDSAVKNALYSILKNKGNIKISELSRIVNSSQRQLRRKFDQWIGVCPKIFCRIIRFQNALQMLHRDSKCNLLSIALDSGYYDQSHFIREFNSYYGLNPSKLLKSKNR